MRESERKEEQMSRCFSSKPMRPRRMFPLSALLFSIILSVFSGGCAPPQSNVGQNPTDSDQIPEITDELIRERINDAFVRQVPEENGAAEPINWSFDEDEPKEIAVVEKQIEGERASVLLDIKTRSAPHMRNPRELEGRIRTEWRLKTGWLLRRWEIVDGENVSMKYKNLTKPPAPSPAR